jgi:hypothetical protein
MWIQKLVPRGMSIVREPKWDLCLETRRGKYNRALRELQQAPLGAKLASQYMLRLTLPCAQAAQECSPSAKLKQQLTPNTKTNQRKKELSLTYVATSLIGFIEHLRRQIRREYTP